MLSSLGLADNQALIWSLGLNILNIILLFVIVRALAYKPIRKFMDARTARVNAAAQEAEKKAQDAEKAKAEYETMLQNGEVEQNNKMEEVRKMAEAEASEILKNAEAKADAILESAGEKAKQAHDAALQDMQSDIVNLAFEISEKLLERSIRDEDTEKLAARLFESHLNGEE